MSPVFSLFGFPSYPRYHVKDIGFNIELNEITHGPPGDRYKKKYMHGFLMKKEI